uniref:Uncharacterized protein n=1 Tax=Opuntia streptacantha TaxID=393608 RepID=A0A7C8YDB8_OPUST
MWQKQARRSSYRESIKVLEADIQHANTLASSLPRDYCGDYVQMRLSCSPLAPCLLYLIEWMDYVCTDSLPNFLGLHHILVYKVGSHIYLSYIYLLVFLRICYFYFFSLRFS